MSQSFSLPDFLESRRELVNRDLERAIRPFYPNSLYQSMRYSLLTDGKRLRPVMCIAACEANGGAVEIALPTASALEMLHTATLIHDDLPMMDNDDLRRGRPTNHKVFGEAVAVLAGDAFLSYSLQYVITHTGAPASLVLRVVRMLVDMIGINGAVSGQVVDLESEHRTDIDLSTVEFIHTRKTGAILTASVATGAVLAGAPEATVERFIRYGEKLGLAFQIIDDLLDLNATEAELGKTPGGDEVAEKATYPRVVGVEKSRRLAVDLIDDAKQELEPLTGEVMPLIAIADYVLARSREPA